MATFSEFIDTLEAEIKQLVGDSLKEFKTDAIADGKAFIEKTKSDLERWTTQLADGELTQDDFKWLVEGKKDLAELAALKRAGLALVRADKFKSALVNLVVNTAVKTFITG